MGVCCPLRVAVVYLACCDVLWHVVACCNVEDAAAGVIDDFEYG